MIDWAHVCPSVDQPTAVQTRRSPPAPLFRLPSQTEAIWQATPCLQPGCPGLAELSQLSGRKGQLGESRWHKSNPFGLSHPPTSEKCGTYFRCSLSFLPGVKDLFTSFQSSCSRPFKALVACFQVVFSGGLTCFGFLSKGNPNNSCEAL